MRTPTAPFRLALALALAAAAPHVRAGPSDEAAKSYRLESSASVAKGAGKLVLAIVPNQGIHVHPQAPLKITIEAPGLELAKTTLGHKDAVDPKAEGPRFEIPFTVKAPGRLEAKAKLDFFVCSDHWCVKQVRDVVVQVDAR